MAIRSNKGIAVALAWPQTYCKQAGAWYDWLLKPLGINNGNYYQAGHAAVILINDQGECSYFDFGRYHTPFGQGRVRGANTDPELSISTRAIWSGDDIINIYEVLNEVAKMEACHGQGDLYSSVFEIDYQKALDTVRVMQSKSPIKYGPFIPGGTNCSRFVNAVLTSSVISIFQKYYLHFPYTLTPSPKSIVNYGKYKMVLATRFRSLRPVQVEIKGVLSAPKRISWMDETFIWHAGEGCGSWFSLAILSPNEIRVKRFSESGRLEFDALYIIETFEICMASPIEIDYLSNYVTLKIKQNGVALTLVRE